MTAIVPNSIARRAVASATTRSSSRRPRWRRLAAALSAGVWLASCGGDGAATREGNGTLIIASTGKPGTLFPPLTTDGQEVAVTSQIFDRLAEIGPDLNAAGDKTFQPRLASSWTWAPDSLSIAFALNPLARWHDGAPVRAEDVRYSFHVYTSPVVASASRSLFSNIDSVTTRDSLTAVFWFKRRTPQQFMDATYPLFVLPSHLLAQIPDSALGTSSFARAPIGSGRFRFVKWEDGVRLELASDTTNARGRAKLDRVIWTYVGDVGAATIKLIAGEADLFEQVRPENLAQILGAPALRLVSNYPLQYNFIGFNLHVPRAPSGPPHPVFGDVRVRRALTMATDRARMVRNVFDSLGMPGISAAPRVLIPDTLALHPLPFDVAAAKALLDSAGWVDSNQDGIREHNGQPLRFDLLIPSTSSTRARLATLLQAALKEVGADMQIVAIEPTALGPRIDASNYDACFCGWGANPGLQGTRQTWESRGSSNSQRYSSAAFDANLDSALTTFDDAKRKTYWTRVFQQTIDDAPAIWMYEQRLPIAVHKRVTPAALRADGWYANLADWSVDPAQRIDRDYRAARAAR